MARKIIFFDKNKWFFEEEVPFDSTNMKIGLKIKKKLYSGKSSFQSIDFYDTYDYGKILVLDGILQTSEKDEFIYHEMLCQIPLFLHKSPKMVLIVGGGDGGSLEEVLKHDIEKVWMVEIDKKVVDLSKKYLPTISKGAFRDKRSEVIFDDGKKYIKDHRNFFDIIILDLSDPGGPAKDLISLKFYQDIKKALKKDGIVSIQSGSFTCQSVLVSTIFKRIKKVFPSVEIRRAVVPAYQAGEYSFTIGAKNNLDKIKPGYILAKYKKLKLGLKYYTPEIHFSTKILPKYFKDLLEEKGNNIDNLYL